VDLASVAIAQAAQRAQELGLADRARFEVGDCTALRFAPHTFDAAMSVDVLWMVPDRPAALREVARVLQPGARFAFTNWDRDLAPPGTPPPVPDHRPLLQAAGFVIETYEEIPEAEAQRRAIYERYIASREALHGEIGAAAAEAMLLEARRALGLLDGIDYLRHSRRIFVVARRS
jgi:ubiquinone/menaquinone biosynthesis C-methylase UbiE